MTMIHKALLLVLPLFRVPLRMLGPVAMIHKVLLLVLPLFRVLLIASWCEQNRICVPDGPPESLDLNYWRLAFESESTDSKSMGSVGSCKVKGVKVVPLEESHTIKGDVGNETEDVSPLEEESELDVFESYQDLLTTLNEEEDFRKRCEVVEQIRLLLKEDEEARMYMGANGFVEALLHFLSSALREAGCLAQESGAMALFNLAVNNNRYSCLIILKESNAITSLFDNNLIHFVLKTSEVY
ncbi:U-box domain-containing protein 6-like [Pyrus x bretschneideri]|uniref:U-box domain-containing protein 6-like n=1 Tax=Pyrus x bretschneideri TaxID=225117 RepID=UPI00202EC067|nr:U-box domain-containing protein 6-like [Pyrus x bretschneideri]